jgi:hypothetical protein
VKKSNIFLFSLAVLSIILLVVILLVKQFRPDWINPYVFLIQLYFIGLSAITYVMLVKGIKGDQQDLYNYYMGTSSARLLISAVIIFLYVYLVKVNKVSFVANFFFLYLFYTVFEIRAVLTNLRAHLKKDSGT